MIACSTAHGNVQCLECKYKRWSSFYRKLQDNISYLQIIKHFIFIQITKKLPCFHMTALKLSYSDYRSICNYTSSIRTSIAASPLRWPILTILVYPPLRSAYFGAISSNNLATRSTSFVFFFLPACAVGTSVTG